MGDGKFKWYVGRGVEPECYDMSCDSREEAIQTGRVEYHHIDGEGFTVVEADKSVISNVFNASHIVEIILDDLIDNNPECWGEDGPDDPWTEKELRDLERRIKGAVGTWLRKHPADTWSFGRQRNEEYFPAPTDAGEVS